MTYVDFITGITFRDIKINTPVSDILAWQDELMNTVLPEEDPFLKRSLNELGYVPRMSTFAVAAVINKAVAQMPENESFVNVGVWHGFTLLSGMLNNKKKTCIGIDNFSEFGDPRRDFLRRFHQYKSSRHYFFNMDYVDYFAHVHKGPIGCYLYDGSHQYQDQFQGLRLAEPFFSKNSIIIIDDTNWVEPRQATLDFIRMSKSYKILLDIVTLCNRHPTFWNGIMVLQKVE